MSDDVPSRHLLLHEVTLLSVLVVNIVSEDLHEKRSFTSVSIAWFWAQSKKTSFGSPTDAITSQAPRPEVRLRKDSFLIFGT